MQGERRTAAMATAVNGTWMPQGGDAAPRGWLALWDGVLCRQRGWLLRLLRCVANKGAQARHKELGAMVQQLRCEQPFVPGQVGRTAYLFVRLLNGTGRLATQGQLRMEKDASLLERLSSHVRELGLMAGMDHLPFERVQRWMEDRMVLEGVMTGIIGELSVSASSGGASYIRHPLLHLAVFEQLCVLARAGEPHRVGRIMVKPMEGKVYYMAMVELGVDNAMDEAARTLWEVEKLASLSGLVEGVRTRWDGNLLRIDIELPA